MVFSFYPVRKYWVFYLFTSCAKINYVFINFLIILLHIMTLTANKPQLIISAVTSTFSSLGIGSTQVSIIREEPQLSGGTFKSFNPLSSINSLTGFTTGRGYLIYPKVAFSVSTLSGGIEEVTVNTYADALDISIGSVKKIITVSVDETDGNTANNIYNYSGVDGVLDLIF